MYAKEFIILISTHSHTHIHYVYNIRTTNSCYYHFLFFLMTLSDSRYYLVSYKYAEVLILIIFDLLFDIFYKKFKKIYEL